MANEELKQRNYHKVLEAGLACFYEYGIENTRIKQLSEKSGISVRSISRYFDNKENFVVKIMEYYLQKQREIISLQTQLYADPCLTGKESLAQFLNLLKQLLLSKPEAFILLADSEQYLSLHSQNKAVIDNQFLNFCQVAQKIKQYLDKGLQDDSITNVTDTKLEAKMLTQTMISLGMQTALMQKIKGYSTQECNQFVSCYIAGILRGLF